MSFARAISFKDVRPGDMVAEGSGEIFGWYQVTACETPNAATVYLYIVGGNVLVGFPHQLIGLFHRPWPEGKTEREMLNAIEVPLRKCVEGSVEEDGSIYVDLRRGEVLDFSVLRDAIEAYELGKPLEQK